MGHQTYSIVVPIKTSEGKIRSELASMGYNEWQGERRCTIDTIIGDMEVKFATFFCSSYEEARIVAQEDDSHYRGQFIKAIPYCEVKSKKLDDFDRRIKETLEKRSAYVQAHRVGDFKAEFVSCPSCKSKIARFYFERNKNRSKDLCPVCYADMASETTKKVLKGYDEKINTLRNEKASLHQSLAKKPTHYYCMCEVHV